MNILSKTIYVCPETGEEFDSPERAEECARLAIKEREESELNKKNSEKIAHSFRLELDDINNFANLLNQKVKEHLKVDLDIKVSFSFYEDLSNSHDAPIGQPTNIYRDGKLPLYYKGWNGNISGKYVKYNKKQIGSDLITRRYTFNHSFFGGFYGINLGSGGGGNNTWNYSIKVFLQDFPLLQEKYDKYLILKQKHEESLLEKRNEISRIDRESLEQKDLIPINSEIQGLHAKIKQLEKEKTEIVLKYRNNNHPVLKKEDVSKEFREIGNFLKL